MSEPAKSHKITVMAKIPIAIYENSLFFPIPLNKLTCSVRILNPLNTAMKHNKANLAVIDLISDANIFATGLNVIIPYNVMNAVVLIAIRFFAPLIKRPEPFLIGLSSLSQELTQASAAAAGKFAYAPASKAITFHTDVADGTEVVVYYKRRIKADVLNNESDVYSEKCTLYVDALGEDKCGNVYRIQFFIPKADFSGEFSLEMGENQTAHAFEAESLAGACGAGGSLWTYTVFGVNTADAE